MARVWTFGDTNNPPMPSLQEEPELIVRTTKRNLPLQQDETEAGVWFPTSSPANDKAWDNWMEFWGPLTAQE